MAYVEKNIDRSLKRLRVDTLDLLQLHWWNYEDPRLFDVINHLCTLQKKGKILHIGVTNFDAENLEKIMSCGAPIVSNQIRFSLFDRRAEKRMLAVCKKHTIKIIAFGTLCGGMLNEKYLGQEDPEKNLEFSKKSLYGKLINNFGGWPLFQKLLQCLSDIAQRHQCSLSCIASRSILEIPEVAAIIIGARLGESNYISQTLKINQIQLTLKEHQSIQTVLDQGRDLSLLMGAVASEYRGKSFIDQPEIRV